MSRTGASTVVLLAIIGGALGWLLEFALVAMGRPIAVPPATLSVALVGIGTVVVLMALPVWRVVRGTATKRIDPFYATRVVVLAKASSLAGALLTGGMAAVTVFVLTRSVLPAVGSIALTVAALVCAVLLLAAGLVAEKMCTLPPRDDGTRTTQLSEELQ